MEYLLIEGQSNKELTTAVNRFLKQGWKPIGGASKHSFTLSNRPNIIYFHYMQGIVRDNKPIQKSSKRLRNSSMSIK